MLVIRFYTEVIVSSEANMFHGHCACALLPAAHITTAVEISQDSYDSSLYIIPVFMPSFRRLSHISLCAH